MSLTLLRDNGGISAHYCPVNPNVPGDRQCRPRGDKGLTMTTTSPMSLYGGVVNRRVTIRDLQAAKEMTVFARRLSRKADENR